VNTAASGLTEIESTSALTKNSLNSGRIEGAYCLSILRELKRDHNGLSFLGFHFFSKKKLQSSSVESTLILFFKASFNSLSFDHIATSNPNDFIFNASAT